MSLNLGEMHSAVILDDSDYNKKMSNLAPTATKAFKAVASAIAAHLSARMLWSFASTGVSAFSSLEESCNRFNNVFRSIPSASGKVAEALQRDFSLSEQSAKDMLAATGDLLTGFGFTQDAALSLSDRAARLGADLASYTNYAGGAKGASEALTMAMLGETERVKALGVVICQDSKEYTTLVEKYMRTEGATLQQAKAMTALDLAMEQSKNAIGDWSRPGETIAQLQMKITEQTNRATAAFGSHLAEGVRPVLSGYNDLLKWYADASPSTQRAVQGIGLLTAGFVFLKSSIGQAAMASTTGGAKALAGFFRVKKQVEFAEEAEAARQRAKETQASLYVQKRDAEEAKALIKTREREEEVAKIKLKAQQQDAIITKKSGGVESPEQIEELKKAEVAYKQAVQNTTAARVGSKAATNAAEESEKLLTTQKVTATAATSAEATATTWAGRAKLTFAANCRAAGDALKSFFASIPFVGWALLGLTAAYELLNIVQKKRRDALDGEIALTHEATDAAKEQADAHKKAREKDNADIKRYQELSKIENLNNAGKKEASDIIERLTKRYGYLGFSINGVTGALEDATDAQKLMSEAQRKEYEQDLTKQLMAGNKEITAAQIGLRDELDSYWNKLGNGAKIVAHLGFANSTGNNGQNMLDDATSTTDIAKQLDSLAEIKNYYLLKNDTKRVEAVQKYIDLLKEQQEREKALAEYRKSREIPNENGSGKTLTDEDIEAYNKYMEAQKQQKFDAADLAEQYKLIEEELDGLNERKNNEIVSETELKDMTKDQLDLMTKINDAEQKRGEILKKSADYAMSLQERYAQLLEDQAISAQEREFERTLKQAEKRGDGSAEALIEQRFNAAQIAARKAQALYDSTYAAANADPFITDEERKVVDKAYENLTKAMRAEDVWRDRLEGYSAGDNRKMVGSFSLAVMNAMLGAGSPEEETAKNTKEMVRLQRQALEKDNSVVYE